MGSFNVDKYEFITSRNDIYNYIMFSLIFCITQIKIIVFFCSMLLKENINLRNSIFVKN